MKKSLADKWVKALRSGEYKQGAAVLKDHGTNTYCCLGVLAEIIGCSDVHQLGYETIMSRIKTVFGRIPSLDVQLSCLNDSGLGSVAPLSFDEIADIIQIHYEEI